MSDCQGCENLMREMDRMANEIDQLRAGLVEAAPEKMVERLAKFLYYNSGYPQGTWDGRIKHAKDTWRKQARAALTAAFTKEGPDDE